jgi:cystathionine beta-lyase
MNCNFDEIIDRRHEKYSYSMKWSKHPMLRSMLEVDEINDDSIAIFTADMDFKCAPPIINALKGVVEHGIFGYSMFPQEYFEAITGWFKRRHNWDILPEEIVYVDGTVEAMKQIILAFTDPGDGVIIQRPVYGPFTGSIEGTGRKVVNNQMIEGENGYYTMDFEDLAEKCKDPANKLILLCSPHNPVGRIWTDGELIELARICRENNVIIAADEIHGDLIRKGEVFHPLATLADNVNIITATAVNTTFNLAGLHCTNLVIKNPELRATFMKSFGLNLPSPFTIAAVIAAYNEGEEWLEAVKDYLDANIDWVLEFLKEKMPKVKCRRPDGTYIMWMDFRAYGLAPEDIHDRIYKKANVLLEGGAMFDPDLGGGFERVCLPSPRSVIKEAFERIAKEFEDVN